MERELKDVLAIVGSPRKEGNCDLLCEEFLHGALDAGHSTLKIYLQDLKIGACMACYGCRKNGECVQKDDMGALLEKMIHADVIVLATPVYFYAMSGQLKTMIDRTLPRYREIADKEFYFIATAAAGKRSMERTMDGLRGFTDCLPGAKVKGVLYGEGVYQKGEVKATNAIREAYEMGKNIACE